MYGLWLIEGLSQWLKWAQATFHERLCVRELIDMYNTHIKVYNDICCIFRDIGTMESNRLQVEWPGWETSGKKKKRNRVRSKVPSHRTILSRMSTMEVRTECLPRLKCIRFPIFALPINFFFWICCVNSFSLLHSISSYSYIQFDYMCKIRQCNEYLSTLKKGDTSDN